MKKYYSTLHFHFEQGLYLRGYDRDFCEKRPNGRLHWTVYTNRGKVGSIEQYRDNYGRRAIYYSVSLVDGGYCGNANTLFEAKQLIAKNCKDVPQNHTSIVSYLADPNAEFFPTPSALAGKMFGNIKKPEEICTVLEPSAGKGDLAELYNSVIFYCHIRAGAGRHLLRTVQQRTILKYRSHKAPPPLF